MSRRDRYKVGGPPLADPFYGFTPGPTPQTYKGARFSAPRPPPDLFRGSYRANGPPLAEPYVPPVFISLLSGRFAAPRPPQDLFRGSYRANGPPLAEPYVPPVFIGLLAARFSAPRPRPDLFRGHYEAGRGYAPGYTHYQGRWAGFHRVRDTGHYEVYIGVDADPDTTAPPDVSSASLPIVIPLPPPGIGVYEYRILVMRRNVYGLRSLVSYSHGGNSSDTYRIKPDGSIDRALPTSPQDVTLTDYPGFYLTASGEYLRSLDGADAADTWRLYIRDDGTDPDPLLDTPTEVTMGGGDTSLLSKRLGPYTPGADVRLLARVYRTVDDKEDEGLDIIQHDVPEQLDPPEGDGFGGRRYLAD